MEIKNKKFLMLVAALGILFPVGVVSAASTTVGATATFLSSLILTPTNMQFGKIIFNGAPAATDTATLSTGGTLAFGGNFSSGGGTVAAGDVAISGTAGNMLDVSCTTTATLGNGAGSTIGMDTIKVAKESAAGAGGVACNGATVVLSFSLTVPTDDQLKIGGRILGPATGGFPGGAYSTTTGGTPVSVTVVYQ